MDRVRILYFKFYIQRIKKLSPSDIFFLKTYHLSFTKNKNKNNESLRDVTKYMPLLNSSSMDVVMNLDNVIDLEKGLDGEFSLTLSGTFYEPTKEFPQPITLDKILPFSERRKETNQSYASNLRIPSVGLLSGLMNL